MNTPFQVEGNIVDLFQERIYPGTVFIKEGRIDRIEENKHSYNRFILPGFIDSHVHIESTMLTPARLAVPIVPRGTIGVVTDPHEIANVLGVEGVEYMIESASRVPVKYFFGAPSCVPSTAFESSGATLGAREVDRLMGKPEVYLLSEMMNFPGVINDDPEVLEKIEAAKNRGLPVDGHAPGLSGDGLKKYAEAGISTDHECSTLPEALEKIQHGMKIQIREGSAARNFDALAPLFNLHPESLMLCTDDIHPDELLTEGHIDRIVKKGLNMGIDLFKLLRAASVTPVLHYRLPVGLLRKGDWADFIVVNNLTEFLVQQSFINGQKIFDINSGILFPTGNEKVLNHFVKNSVSENDLELKWPAHKSKIKVIQCFDGGLVTDSFIYEPEKEDDHVVRGDVDSDILKIVVIDRYRKAVPAIGFIRGFELKSGALASSVAHDSHNVVAVGTSDADIVKAVNLIMETGGGLAAADGPHQDVLPLPVAGLMSDLPAEEVARSYARVDKMAHKLGSKLAAPFMTLSFMSLLVIPKLKIGDKGLFDVDRFSLVSLFE